MKPETETETRITQLMADAASITQLITDLAELRNQVANLQNERDGLVAQVEKVRAERNGLSSQLSSLHRILIDARDCVRICQKQGWAEYRLLQSIDQELLKDSYAQCLREIQAEAIQKATTYLAESIPCKLHESVIFKDRYVYISTRYLRDYADKVRQGGEK